jgi:hypothetical protein
VTDTGERTHNREVGVLLDGGFDLLIVLLDRRAQQLKLAHETLYKDRRAVHYGTILSGRHRLVNLANELVNIRRT